MLERDLQNLIVSFCQRQKLLVYHTFDSRRSEPGFPDLVIVGGNGVVYRELKKQDGRLTRDQQHWLAALEAAGENAGVWRPSDWPDNVRSDLSHLTRLTVERPAPTQAEVRRALARRGAKNVPPPGMV
jgi:hypothetical protein